MTSCRRMVATSLLIAASVSLSALGCTAGDQTSDDRTTGHQTAQENTSAHQKASSAKLDSASDRFTAKNAANSALTEFEFLEIRMAIPVRIKVYAADEPTANQAVKAAYSRIRQLDRRLSDFDPQSELMRLCRSSQPGHPVDVGEELFAVLTKAAEVSRLTDGAFDVTVGPLTSLWRKVRRRKVLPSEDELNAARSLVGWQNVRLDEKTRTVELLRAKMRLDLGGIAKGYAADEARRILAEHGLTRVLIDAGGDIVLGDPPPGRTGWRVGIAPLDDPRGTPSRFVTLTDVSIATSGDASQHVEIDGVRYSHIVDPTTGLGVTQPSSVTVIAPDGITADSLASAISVLGPDRGVRCIEALDQIEAIVVTRSPSGDVRTHASSGIPAFESSPDMQTQP